MINIVVGMSSQASGSGSTSSNAQPSALSSQSFESELSEAISDALTKLGVDPGSVQLTVQDSDGNNIGTSQNSVPASSPASSPPTTPAPVAAAALASTPAASTVSFDDQYWSKQPVAVQQLRDIPDQNERTQLGEQLAGEGYSIDVPVMVWGWDPSVTTQLRQSYGYTWVPSGLQPAVESAPGINDPGLTPYDPNHPPAGSIAV